MTKPKSAVVVANRLARVKQTPVAPAWAIDAALGRSRPHRGLEEVMRDLEEEAGTVRRLSGLLDQLPPAWPARLTGDDLL